MRRKKCETYASIGTGLRYSSYSLAVSGGVLEKSCQTVAGGDGASMASLGGVVVGKAIAKPAFSLDPFS